MVLFVHLIYFLEVRKQPFEIALLSENFRFACRHFGGLFESAALAIPQRCSSRIVLFHLAWNVLLSFPQITIFVLKETSSRSFRCLHISSAHFAADPGNSGDAPVIPTPNKNQTENEGDLLWYAIVSELLNLCFRRQEWLVKNGGTKQRRSCPNSRC